MPLPFMSRRLFLQMVVLAGSPFVFIAMQACTVRSESVQSWHPGWARHPGQVRLVHEVAEATRQSPARLNALLNDAHRRQDVLDAISRPAESKPWKAYRKIFLTNKRLHDGVAFYLDHRDLLERMARRYGVPPQIIIAILGVETFYCRKTGHYNVLDALVTLALYYPPRADFFREQLKTLLALPIANQTLRVRQLTGSYAGAQGCPQFMPSSIRDDAIDAAGKGYVDLYHSLPDIFASVAHYLSRHGWKRGAPVAVRARPGAIEWHLQWQPTPTWTLKQLKTRGYVPLQPVSSDQRVSLLTLEDNHGFNYWLTFANFKVITLYNRSPLYAMVVYRLARAIAMKVRAHDRIRFIDLTGGHDDGITDPLNESSALSISRQFCRHAWWQNI